MDYRILEDIIEGAKTSGRHFSDVDYSFEAKAPHDYVTEIDKLIQDEIISFLSQRHPHALFIAEEQENGSLETALEQGCFIIDPLDGTLNFLNGIPLCCVSIAYAEHGQIQAGVVHAPLMGETFSAVRGDGAWLNYGKDDARTLCCFELPLELGLIQVESGWHADRQYVADYALSSRSLGSCALAAAWVAAGRSAGYISVPIAKIWDMAAAALICEEVGLCICEPDGSEFKLKLQGQFFACREEDKDAFVEMIGACESRYISRDKR